MNKKGFTLVEILIAVVLIGLIFGIGIPGIMKISERAKGKSYDTKKDLIEKAAELYGESNKNILQEGVCDIDGKEYQCKKVSIKTLIEEGYLDNEDKTSNEIVYNNPKTDKNIADACVNIYKKNNRIYAYFYNDDIETSCNYDDETTDIDKQKFLASLCETNEVLPYNDKKTLAYQILCKAKKGINGTVYQSVTSFPRTTESDKILSYANDDYGISYYYRGNIKDNYVRFAGFTWRIVRINGDGSIRLILNNSLTRSCGYLNSAVCSSSVFNTKYNDNAYVGYMYGLAGTTTDKKRCLMLENNEVVDKISNYATQTSCESNGGTWTEDAFAATHATIKSSTIKEKVDLFYETFLKTNYSNYLADAIFCGDKSLAWGPGTGNTSTGYNSYNRLNNPTLKCETKFSAYTVSKNLKYPIALLSADELIMAGGSTGENKTYYLYVTDLNSWWLLSPTGTYDTTDCGENHAIVHHSSTNYYIANDYDSAYVDNPDLVRPVINLKKDILINAGDGTREDPYKVTLN